MTVLGRVAAWAYDHRRAVVLAWVGVVVAAIAAAQLVGTHFRDTFSAGDTPSARALAILEQHFPSRAGGEAQVVFDTADPVRSARAQASIAALARHLTAVPQVASVVAPLVGRGQGAAQISRTGHIAFATVTFDVTADRVPKAAARRLVDTAEGARRPGFDVELGGQVVGSVVSAAPGSAEGIGTGAAMVIMLIAFGSVVAMGLPVVTALCGLLAGVGLLELLTRLLVVPTFSPEMAAMIALGVGIDYALFIVTRFRQSLGEGRDPRAAVVASLSTAGRAVLFAGSTVVISLLGLYLVGEAYMVGLSTACIVAVLLVMLAALTLLPAVLGFAGRAVDRLTVPGLRRGAASPAGAPAGFWVRWSRTVQRRAALTGAAAVLLLVALALPIFSMRLAFTDASNDPPSLTTRQAYDLLAKGFGPGSNGPLVVAVAADSPGAGVAGTAARLEAAFRGVPDVAAVPPPVFDRARTAAIVTVVPKSAPQAAATTELVERLRTSVIPPVLRGSGVVAEVGGETAAGIDAATFLGSRTPLVIGVVVALAFLLLVAVFRSVLVPLKAAVVNLLSIGAAYGVLVAVFQWGWLGGLVGIGRTGPIDPWIPLTMFTILFGLSMDYEVFLLSRIREEWLATGDASRSVADGLALTARVITAAAAIMVCVFGSFVVHDPLHILKVFGLGMAVAVLVDATVVRTVLVPSVMELLGRANWWMPRWLDRAVPSLGVEAARTAGGGP
jgi:RND superfamily putative drug exporter